MQRKLFCEINRTCYRISLAKEILRRNLKDLFSGQKIARERSGETLPVIVKSHSSILLRKLHGVDIRLQENKVTNIMLACSKINGLIIHPGEIFSFWKMIGNPTKRAGYKEGLVISKNNLSKGYGGGLCQLANMIHWLVLNSPLTVTELHHHSDALFPDDRRRVPFGTGTSVAYNSVDYRFKNTTDQDVQLLVWCEDGDLCGELRTTREFPNRYRLSSVQVSLYSMIPEHHDAITKMPGSFKKTKDAILKLIENDIPLQISCPTMKENKDDYLYVQKWAHEHKVRAITDYIMMARYDHTTGNLGHRLSLDEVGKVIEDILEEDMDYKNEILKPDFVERCEKLEENLDDRICGVGISSCCMVANGNVYPCAGWQDYICGNLNQQSLKEIWESSPKMQYLRSLRKRDFKECIGCEDKAFCALCMVRNANENPEGNPLIINKHFCKVAALNKKIVLDWRKKILTQEK